MRLVRATRLLMQSLSKPGPPRVVDLVTDDPDDLLERGVLLPPDLAGHIAHRDQRLAFQVLPGTVDADS